MHLEADDSSTHLPILPTDWDDSEASLNQISTSIKGKSDATSNGQANSGSAASANDNLWEDNWDDDDIEDDFSVQLRCVLSV